MSCADVCLDHDYDAYNEFEHTTMVTARKPHVCCECHEKIQPGQRYERCVGKSDGRIWTAVTCGLCAEIRAAFVCGSWQFGELWESIDEAMFPIWETQGPIDCLAKVETLEARDKLREAYRVWREVAHR